MKRIPVLLAASAVLFCCTACDESALTEPLLPEQSAEQTAALTPAFPTPEETATATPTQALLTFTPEPTPASFALDAEQTVRLEREVAAPLAATLYASQMSGNGMMNFSIPVNDLSSYNFDAAMSMWQGYFATMADTQLDLEDSYQWLAQQVFPSFQRDIGTDGTYSYAVPESEAASYFSDAFGSSIPLSGTISQDASNAVFACGAGDAAPILVPGGSSSYEEGYVDAGYISFQFGYIGADGALCDLNVILSVIPSDSSRYGCTVQSFEVTQLTTSYVPGTPEPAVTSFDEQGFVFADSSERYLAAEELAALTPEMLNYAKNEIYARHGNVFLNTEYRNHYSQYPWYEALPKKSGVGFDDFNEIEAANVELLNQFGAQ